MHFDSLKDEQKECLNSKITAQEPLLDANCRAFVTVPEVQSMNVKAKDNGLKFGPFEFYGVSTQADGKNMQVKSASDKEFRWPSNSLYVFYPLKKQLTLGFGSPEYSNSFGENEKMGEGSVFKFLQQPDKMDEADFKPVKIWAGHKHTIV